MKTIFLFFLGIFFILLLSFSPISAQVYFEGDVYFRINEGIFTTWGKLADRQELIKIFGSCFKGLEDSTSGRYSIKGDASQTIFNSQKVKNELYRVISGRITIKGIVESLEYSEIIAEETKTDTLIVMPPFIGFYSVFPDAINSAVIKTIIKKISERKLYCRVKAGINTVIFDVPDNEIELLRAAIKKNSTIVIEFDYQKNFSDGNRGNSHIIITKKGKMIFLEKDYEYAAQKKEAIKNGSYGAIHFAQIKEIN